jgi:hypothetical protein
VCVPGQRSKSDVFRAQISSNQIFSTATQSTRRLGFQGLARTFTLVLVFWILNCEFSHWKCSNYSLDCREGHMKRISLSVCLSVCGGVCVKGKKNIGLEISTKQFSNLHYRHIRFQGTTVLASQVFRSQAFSQSDF